MLRVLSYVWLIHSLPVFICSYLVVRVLTFRVFETLLVRSILVVLVYSIASSVVLETGLIKTDDLSMHFAAMLLFIPFPILLISLPHFYRVWKRSREL